MKTFLKIFLMLFITFSLVFGGVMYFIYKDDVKDAQENKGDEVTNEFDNLDVSGYKDRTNVLLLGVDALESVGDGKGTRTDTIMVLSLDPVTKTGFILSIPRDTRVLIPGRNIYDKVNHAHSYGGTELAISTIKNFLNIPIHHYVKVDYRALFKVVDDLGGIEVDVPIDMKYTDTAATPPLYIDLKAGVQTLNGEQAMGFLRFRKGYANQDLGRIQAQQQFMDALLKKVVSPASIIKIPKHIETISEYVQTDMSIKDMLVLAKQGLSVDLKRIEKKTIAGYPDMINGVSYYSVDEKGKQEMLDYLLSGDYPVPEPEVEAEDITGTTGSAPVTEKEVIEININDYNIHILNGSGTSGVARRASDLLKIQDIIVDSTGNAPNFDYANTMIYYKEDGKTASKLKSIIGVGKLEKGTKSIVASQPDFVIVLGKDFK